jgi:hypothetical protein
MRLLLTIVLILVSGIAAAPTAAPQSFDSLDLARPQNYSAYRVSSDHRFELSNADNKQIMPSETLVMADLAGPGMVAHIWITIAHNEFAWPRLLRLRVYYDGAKTPSVDAPLGDFFGIGHGYERNLDSMMIRNSSFGRARNSYWPMPFRKSCRITVTNEGNRMLPMFYYHVDARQYDSLPDDIRYFHAYYRQERPAMAGRIYEFLNTRGRGHYVGTVLSVLQSQVGWFGEGDDLFYIDGAQKPQIYGTGSEDYFTDAWDLRVSNGLWTGIPVAEGVRLGARLTGYRWHIPDPIPFNESLRAAIEHAGWTYNSEGKLRSGFEERADFFSSVAFWYQEGVNEGLPEPPYGEARLPLGNAQQIPAAESIKGTTTEKGKASLLKEVDWSKDLLLFEAEGPGARIHIPVDIPADGRYEIIAMVAQAPDYGDYTVLLDGKPTNEDKRALATSEVPPPGPEVLHNFQHEVYIAVDRPLGWYQLTRGRHTLTFVCVGKAPHSFGYNLGINDLVLQKVPDFEREAKPPKHFPAAAGKTIPTVPQSVPVYRGLPLAAYREMLKRASEAERPEALRAIGSFGEDAAPAASEVAEALSDPNDQVRSAAAWALAQIGPQGGFAVSALARSLSDPSPRVRHLAAIALKAVGPRAAPAIPQLVGALNDPSEYVRVRAADALGAMGPAASSAVRPLAERLLAKDERGLVLGSIATALGNIGPDAKDALPALEQVAKMRRLGASAQEAILRIEGKPVPTRR